MDANNSDNTTSMMNKENPTRDYYKLKEKYQIVMNKKKEKIKKNNTLTTNEKRKEIKDIKYRCVNCGKEGGTTFDESNGMLKAICNASEPCDLNMNIKRVMYKNVRDLSKLYNKEAESLKMRIIITKLDYLFGINSSKDDIIERFNTLKVELSNISEKDIILNKNYGNIISGINRDPLLNDAKMNLENEIYELKELYKEYLTNPSQKYIETIVDIYMNKITPLLEQIRKMKYEYYKIEEINDDSVLVALPYKEARLEQSM